MPMSYSFILTAHTACIAKPVLPKSQTSVFSTRFGHVLFAILFLASSAMLCYAQTDTAALADREIVRRQENSILASKLVIKGDQAAREESWELAYVSYLEALEMTSNAGERAPVLQKFSSAALSYARWLVDNGRYGEAEKAAKTVLLPQFNPTYTPAVNFLSELEQGQSTFNRTVTPQFAANREEVAKLLVEADGFFGTGRFDLAMKRYEQVLGIDRYNSAARMGMERVNLQKSNYYKEAYNETRSRMLWQVTRAWERPVRKFETRDTASGADSRNLSGASTEAITAKLNRIIIPRIDLRDTTVREAVEFLKQRSRELDTTTTDPAERKGVNIVLKLSSLQPAITASDIPADSAILGAEIAAPVVTAESPITLSLSNVPLVEALRYLTELAGLKYKVEPFAVSIVPITENTDELVTKEYRVPPGFIPSDSGVADTNPVAGRSLELGDARLKGRTNALEYLKTQGVLFPTGAFAQYVPAGSKLIVRNTLNAIDLIDILVSAALGVQPTQVEIESKFLEITQNNLKELGFNWLLGPLSIGGGMFGSGGTQGFGTDLQPRGPDSSAFPFNVGGTPVGADPVTGGIRSGTGLGPNAAVTANGLDALLNPALALGQAPAIFGLSGVFTNPQFQVVIRALNQKKGVDLMSAPKVVTKSGNKAVIKVVRNFPYPTEFAPPEPPPVSTGAGSAGVVAVPTGALISGGLVTPTTPTAFETRDVGVTLEVEPVVGPDNYTIDLNLAPEVVEFEGFINYGSPILSARFLSPAQGGLPGLGTIQQTIITPNVINQPIFSTRKVTTSVSIWDGQTVALGGLIREDVQKVQDKVPILGDIPLAGRLFRSDVDQKIKRNLIIFVTARLMDAAGLPIRRDDEQEEIVEVLGLPEELPPPAFETVRSLGK